MRIRENPKKVSTSDFWYDVLEAGYIQPEDHLIPEDAMEVRKAIATVYQFYDVLEDNNLIEYT